LLVAVEVRQVVAVLVVIAATSQEKTLAVGHLLKRHYLSIF
jgi:hypothetical protein